MKTTSKKAFTFTELMVTLSIFTVIMAAIYTTFIVGNRSWVLFNTHAVLQRETRDCMIQLTKELRKAKDILIIRDAESLRVNFIRPTLGSVSYLWSSAGENANKLMRTNQGGTRVLANNVAFLSLEQTQDSIVIDLTTEIRNKSGEKATFRLKEKVARRR